MVSSRHTHNIQTVEFGKKEEDEAVVAAKKMYFFPSPLASSSAGRGCITSFRPAAATHLPPPLPQSESTPDRLFFTGLEEREERLERITVSPPPHASSCLSPPPVWPAKGERGPAVCYDCCCLLCSTYVLGNYSPPQVGEKRAR